MAEQRIRTGYRLAELPASTRGIIVTTLVAFALAPIAMGIASLAAGWHPTGDVAIIAIRSGDAWTGDAPLVGQPTTGEEFTGTPSNHPGPIQFWVLGVTTRALGTSAGTLLGAAALNAAALVATVWLAFRRGGPVLFALVSAALAALAASLGAGALHDPFNSELATFPMVAALFAAWSVTVGDLRTTPVLIAAGSVAAQVHVAGAAFVAPLGIAAGAALWSAWRNHPATVGRDRPWLLGSAALALLAWAPVIAQELSRGPSNVAALWTTATAPRPRIGLSFMGERLATALAPVPTFLRPTGRFGFLVDASPVGVYAGAAVLGGALALAVHLHLADRRSHAARLIGLVAAAGMLSLVAAAGQPPLAAFRADGTRWLWVVGFGTWLGGAWAAWQVVPAKRRDRAARLAVPIGAATSILVLIATLVSSPIEDQRDGQLMAATDRAATETISALPPGAYRVRFEGNQALVTVGPGIAARLEGAGRPVTLDDNAFTRGYGSERTSNRPTDGELRITSGTGPAAPQGDELIVEVPADDRDPAAGTIRVYRS